MVSLVAKRGAGILSESFFALGVAGWRAGLYRLRAGPCGGMKREGLLFLRCAALGPRGIAMRPRQKAKVDW